MKVFLLGYPGDLGGANTEAWHTVKLWRQASIDVTAIPLWDCPPPGDKWRARLDSIGVPTIGVESAARVEANRDLPPGLAGGVAVCFCHTGFLRSAAAWRSIGCRVVWVGCMNWLFPAERLHYGTHGLFERYVFQSHYQARHVGDLLTRWGYTPDRGRVIRGAFDPAEFPCRPLPHDTGTPLVVGRVSRAAKDKWHRRSWDWYGAVASPIRVRALGWSKEVRNIVGPPPPWAECLEERSIEPVEFYRTLHAFAPINGGAVENWPRVGLEAMASGVPLVVERTGGWPEMLGEADGESAPAGLTWSTCGEFAGHLERLATDEAYRMDHVWAGRARVEELAAPGPIADAWWELFRGLGG